MLRLDRFRSFQSHPWLKKAYSRLSAEDIALAEQFIVANDPLGRDDFEIKVNRMFLDKPKPKNFTIILELLSNCNTV